MNKQSYLRKLRKSLKGTEKAEVENLISYYAELIDDGVESGKSEAEACADLEPPECVAENYRREKGASYEAKKPRKNKSLGGMPVLLIVLGFPLWLPLLIAAFVLALAFVIVLAALVVAAFCAGLGLIVGGLYAIVMSFGLFGGHAAIAFVQIGMGLALIGLGLLFSMGVLPLLCKAVASLFRWIFRGFKPAPKTVSRSRRGSVAAMVSSSAVFLVGILVGFFSFAGLGFDYRNLVVTGEIREVTETISLENLEGLDIQSDNLKITVKQTDGEARFVYNDAEEMPKMYSFEGGTVTLKQGEDLFDSWKLSWNYGIFSFATFNGLNEATLYLPQDYAGGLSVSTANGAVSMENMSLGDCILTTQNGAMNIAECNLSSLSLKSKNGAVSLKNVDCAGMVSVEATNGALKADNVSASAMRFTADNGAIALQDVEVANLYAKTQNGAIRLTRVSADSLEFITSNGAVKGSIGGKPSEYKISAATGNGSCNLQNTSSGEKTLTVRTGNGAIKISFTEDTENG